MTQQPYKWMKEKDNNTVIDIKVVPNSSKNLIILEDEFLKIKLTASPVDNKANQALIEFLSKKLKVAKTSINIISGQTSKNKKIMLPISINECINSLINE